MMRFYASGFIICHIILQSQARRFGIKNNERLISSESRYRSSPDYEEDYPHYDVRKEPDLPVSFQAPRHSAHDYWRYKHGHDNRKTFFEDLPYGQTTSFPGFYQFMTSLFGGRDDAAPEHPHPYHYNRNRVTNPYPIPPYSFRPTEPNYIPPPKPIRASVIKLETITRSPNLYPSFENEMTTKYYPHAGSILKHVLIENAKTQPEFQPILPFKPLPVLPKPVHVPATTLKPTYKKFYNRTSHFYNETDFKYPESVQDQLPNLGLEVKIPYVSERPLPHIFNTLSTETSTFVDLYPPSTTNTLDLIDIRSLNWPNADRRDRPVVIQFESNATYEEPRAQKSFPGAVEKVKRPVIKFTKKLSTQDRIPVERVTNLTVEGLSKVEKDNANIHKYVNHFNMRNLINYELSKFDSSQDPRGKHENSTKAVDIDDELSLDAKILKDTNWDGLTISTTTATEQSRETTTTVVEIKPKTVTHAFWEIDDNKTTPKPDTTTEESTETFTEETSTLFLDRKLDYQDTKLTTEEIFETTTTERTTPSIIRRRYSRRPKIMTFTPYPTPEEVQKKLINRNHFSKRQKPNITLAFGNKNVLRREGLEVMKFSDDDVKKRRKIGKRRQIYKRTRVVTSERPVQLH